MEGVLASITKVAISALPQGYSRLLHSTFNSLRLKALGQNFKMLIDLTSSLYMKDHTDLSSVSSQNPRSACKHGAVVKSSQ